MSQSRHPRVQTQLFGKDVLDVVGFDGFEVTGDGSLGHDDDRFAFPQLSVLSVRRSDVRPNSEELVMEVRNADDGFGSLF